jgi:hypothetical protein
MKLFLAQMLFRTSITGNALKKEKTGIKGEKR